VDLWRIEVSAKLAAQFGVRTEFGSLDSMLAALAQQFCMGDLEDARARLILKFDGRPSVA